MLKIHAVNLRDFDLNLLRVLDALFVEGSVNKAASRLRLSQPATSNALSRLRAQLGDPLFVRTRSGMAPTPRALELKGPLSAALRQVQEALSPPPAFDPAQARHTFVIAASDHAQLLVIPRFAEVLARYPGLKLRVVALPRDFPMTELESGELDLVLGAFDLAPGDAAPRGLKRQVIAKDPYVLVARKGHPGLKRIDLNRPQLHVAPRGGSTGKPDRKLKLERNVVLYVPHYLVAPWVLTETEQLAALPASIAKRFCEHFPLEQVPVPIAHEPIKVQQLWHPHRHGQPAHQWLRGQLLSAASERTPEPRRRTP